MSLYNAEPFTFDGMVSQLCSITKNFPDKRTGDNTFYSITDAALGAFAVFFTQNPSFLAFQDDMQKSKGKSNAQTLFIMDKIPCDNHIRDLMDEVPPSYIFPMFSYIFNGLHALGYLDEFRSINNTLLIALDGTEYFSSQKIHCDNCSQKKHRNGTITYFHTAVTPVIVAPGNNKVISLQPEFVKPQDGHKKQDCENAAAKRWFSQYGQQYRDIGITILGDDLYSNHPICKIILEEELHFILVCKADSHKILYQWIAEFEAMGEVQTLVNERWTGKHYEIDTYRFFNKVPLRDSEDSLYVNWCEIITTLEDGTVVYKNAFISDYEISKGNVQEVVKAGRARWKVENENNNVLKTKGYHLEHNFGHGKKYLSYVLFTLNILAFLFHTVLEMMDKKYLVIRNNLSARKTFFDDIRALTRYICFNSWNEMLNFMIQGLEIEFIDTS